MTATIPKFEKARSVGSEQRIPHIIHQTFQRTDVPAAMHRAAMSWLDKNPSYDYRFYDDDDHFRFLRQHFEPRVVEAYGKITEGAFRADLWRYCILYAFGGVYADIDTICVTPLDELIKPTDEFIVPTVTAARPNAVFNAFICSAPKHPFLKQAISYACDNVLGNEPFDGFTMVGPGALGLAMNFALKRDPETAHKAGSFTSNGLTYRVLEKRAAEGDKPPLVLNNASIVMLSRYEGYFEDLEALGHVHWTENRVKPSLMRRLLNRARAHFR